MDKNSGKRPSNPVPSFQQFIGSQAAAGASADPLLSYYQQQQGGGVFGPQFVANNNMQRASSMGGNYVPLPSQYSQMQHMQHMQQMQQMYFGNAGAAAFGAQLSFRTAPSGYASQHAAAIVAQTQQPASSAVPSLQQAAGASVQHSTVAGTELRPESSRKRTADRRESLIDVKQLAKREVEDEDDIQILSSSTPSARLQSRRLARLAVPDHAPLLAVVACLQQSIQQLAAVAAAMQPSAAPAAPAAAPIPQPQPTPTMVPAQSTPVRESSVDRQIQEKLEELNDDQKKQLIDMMKGGSGELNAVKPTLAETPAAHSDGDSTPAAQLPAATIPATHSAAAETTAAHPSAAATSGDDLAGATTHTTPLASSATHAAHPATATAALAEADATHDRDLEFLNGNSSEETRCPACDQLTSGSSISRERHYIKFHYNIFFVLKPRRLGRVEIFLSQLLGDARKSSKYAARACLQCPDDSHIFNSRFALLNHLREAHPEHFDEVKKAYEEIERDGEIVDRQTHAALKASSVAPSISENVKRRRGRPPKNSF